MELKEGLSGLPQDESEERLAFYSEMIDDRMEEGLSEEDAVGGIGAVDTIVSQIVADIPLTKLLKQRIMSKKRLSAWKIVLIVLGSPVWLSLLIAVFAVILALYVSIWAVIIALWAVFVSFASCALGSVAVAVIEFAHGGVHTGIAAIGAGVVCAGLSIFMFCGCKLATKGALLLTKKITLNIKKYFIKKDKDNE
ncbi:MAG: DUF1700 domain-containing protein [Clostridia bacterium]|nr:DUF1700 domain-containing protein [Clostridia bacterium]